MIVVVYEYNNIIKFKIILIIIMKPITDLNVIKRKRKQEKGDQTF